MVEINVTDATGKQPKKGGFFANQPENNNFQETTSFKLVIPKIPETTYFCQKVNLPGISIGSLSQETLFNGILHPSGKITHEAFTASFIVSEGLSNWREIYDWIQSCSTYTDFEKYAGEQNSLVSDAKLYVLSSKNNPEIIATFYGLFPISLGSISFDYSDSELQTIVSEVTFAFSHYEIEVT